MEGFVRGDGRFGVGGNGFAFTIFHQNNSLLNLDIAFNDKMNHPVSLSSLAINAGESLTFRVYDKGNNEYDPGVFNFQISFVHPPSVGGIIALQGTENSVQPLDFTFRPITGSAFTRTIMLNFAGGYSINDIPPDMYTVSIKGAKWLRKNITVDTRNGNVTDANARLLAGDANNDNACDITDLLLLIAHYNQVSPNAGFLDTADFNCDGVNDITDLLLLVANYNKMGNS